MDLTTHWDHIQIECVNTHKALQLVAAEIFRTEELGVSCTLVDKSTFPQAFSNNFLIESAGKINISNLEIRYNYLVRHAASSMLQVWDEFDRFLSVFEQINRLGFQLGYSYEICSSGLRVLNQEYEKDVINRLSEVAIELENKKNSLFWNLPSIVYEILADLKFESKSLANALEHIIKITNNGLVTRQLSQAVESLAATSQVNADILYNEFLGRLDSPVVYLSISVLLGLAKFSLQEAHRRALALARSEQLIYRRVGISCLGYFQYSNDEIHQRLLKVTIDCFEAFRETINPEIDADLAKAYGNLTGKSEKAQRAFMELTSRDNLTIKDQVAQILVLKSNEAFNQSWYREAIFNLTQPSLPSLGMIERLSFCIQQHYVKNEPDTALDMIEAFAANWDYCIADEDKDLPNILYTTLIELYNNHLEILLKGITRWFASSNQRLHLAAWKVQLHFSRIQTQTSPNSEINEESIRKKMEESAKITLSKQVLDNLDEQTVEYIIYRVAGYVVDAYSLDSILLSALSREPSSTNINNLVASILAEYVLYNYPIDGGNFLKYFLSLETTSKLEKEVIQTALTHSNSYFEARENLPRLKELKTPSQRIYPLRLAEWKYQASVMEEARKRSIFSLMVTNIPLKYGRSFSVAQDGKFTEPSKLSTFYYEQEKPQGELIDPVGQAFQRLYWRNIGLNENSHAGDIDL
ncbi:MAG: hypothetical protein IM585_16620 [Pseudanabaena sp. M135S2SP2A07QC]|jgi:hypothetical protein|nr:hypothetical protein [Pseudanabaena sp. M090S1SP2A07QC]MCA6508077.1 hypothetical protein [Pseudanabaena sp. M172S2SP2A07QC]MCA6521423.1 hypothetical protein [Pseudanabaena sp. M051S1SP2A07QC]MCA6524963.1 hypothetical protein [Pseudanabaena sp. M179S2SP2A07QC]MCA6531482.1 hypothetical protein [Pseudanabaena sp. M125S2SP2A07QC]MCA6534236.1 hypothetical protein [Pseudanabaena sp. M176S2SP2A07QC]MCA6539926.1 hypothetical protein [Pseudanabaena sp. M037S2SP2A07QC]MCA6541803.1 hypothetical prot